MRIKRFNEKIETGHATIGDVIGAADLIVGFSENEYRDIFDDDFTFDNTNLYTFDGGYCIWFYESVHISSSIDARKAHPLTDLVFIYRNDGEFPTAIFRVNELSAINYFNNTITMIGREIARFYDVNTWQNRDEITF